jgi:tetrapyrrole methylase family protein/MazG family protein
LKKSQEEGTRSQKQLDNQDRLRGPDGCPWDKEQDERSIVSYFLEEVYEAVDALYRKDAAAIAEEMGDVLMEVVFLSRIFEERRAFSVSDALAAINKKMIRRHPHVFGRSKIRSSQGVLTEWIKSKKTEKKRQSYFEGFSTMTPALQAALQIGERVSHFGFDWSSAGAALEKVEEEIGEMKDALTSRPAGNVEEELGDAFFALAQFARKLRLNPEIVLRRANAKFIKRFAELEKRLARRRKALSGVSLKEMDRIWDEIKKRERASRSPSSSSGRGRL